MKKTVSLCNICGNIFDMLDEQEHFGIHYDVGYGSTHDGERIDVDFCCKCFDRLIDCLLPQCTIDPITRKAE